MSQKTTSKRKTNTLRQSNFEMVKEFMGVFGQTIDVDLLIPSPEAFRLLQLRMNLMKDKRLKAEHAAKEYCVLSQHSADFATPEDFRTAVTEFVAGLTDQLYVIYGTFAAFGLNADEAFRIVHEFRMSKFGDPVSIEVALQKPDLTSLLK